MLLIASCLHLPTNPQRPQVEGSTGRGSNLVRGAWRTIQEGGEASD